jgi:hypothetical protein
MKHSGNTIVGFYIERGAPMPRLMRRTQKLCQAFLRCAVVDSAPTAAGLSSPALGQQ